MKIHYDFTVSATDAMVIEGSIRDSIVKLLVAQMKRISENDMEYFDLYEKQITDYQGLIKKMEFTQINEE